MAKASPDRPFTPAGFFAFRTPLLPFEELEAFGEGLEAPAALAAEDPGRLEAALAADRERLRARLAVLSERPEVLEAVFLASPSLYESLAAWRAQPDGKKGQRAERALVRYFYRMMARATPFGLFSGCSVGRVETAPGSPTRIAVGPRAAYERHTRLDMDYLFALCEDLARDPAVRESLTYRPNSSLYQAAGRLRYAEARLEKKVRSHHLVAVDSNDYLDEALRRAEGGARAGEIAAALVAFDPDGEVTIDEASEFVTELIDSQILVSDLSTPVTGPEPIHDMIDQLRRIPLPATAQAAEKLAQVRTTLEELDAGGPGPRPSRYEAVAEALKDLPTPVEMSRLFQLDMVKPADRPALGADALAEIQRGVEILLRLAVDRPAEGLEKFRKDFNERYESREMPLLQALDEEVGIGFERSGDFGAEASPLLRGIAVGAAAADPTSPGDAPRRCCSPSSTARWRRARGRSSSPPRTSTAWRRQTRPARPRSRAGKRRSPTPSTSWSPSPPPRRRRSIAGTSRSCSRTPAARRERACWAASATPTPSSAATPRSTCGPRRRTARTPSSPRSSTCRRGGSATSWRGRSCASTRSPSSAARERRRRSRSR